MCALSDVGLSHMGSPRWSTRSKGMQPNTCCQIRQADKFPTSSRYAIIVVLRTSATNDCLLGQRILITAIFPPYGDQIDPHSQNEARNTSVFTRTLSKPASETLFSPFESKRWSRPPSSEREASEDSEIVFDTDVSPSAHETLAPALFQINETSSISGALRKARWGFFWAPKDFETDIPSSKRDIRRWLIRKAERYDV